MAAFAAAFIGSGTSKCGCPMLRLTGFLSDRARSNTLRTPDTSIAPHRSASHDSGITGASKTEEEKPHDKRRKRHDQRKQSSNYSLPLIVSSLRLSCGFFFSF